MISKKLVEEEREELLAELSRENEELRKRVNSEPVKEVSGGEGLVSRLLYEDVQKWNKELMAENEKLKGWMKKECGEHELMNMEMQAKAVKMRECLWDAVIVVNKLVRERCVCGGMRGRHEVNCEAMNLVNRMNEVRK